MVTITAQNILDENNYTISDISLVNTELLCNNAINYINLRTGLSISNMSGQTVSVANNQAPIIVMLTGLMIRAYKDRGPSTGIGGMSISTLISDPQYQLFKDLIDKGIDSLKSMSFQRT